MIVLNTICLKISMIVLINPCDNNDELIYEVYLYITCNYFNENTIRYLKYIEIIKHGLVI